MKALGNDGRWHEFGKLSKAERDGWMEAMAIADRKVCERHSETRRPTIEENLALYEERHRIW